VHASPPSRLQRTLLATLAGGLAISSCSTDGSDRVTSPPPETAVSPTEAASPTPPRNRRPPEPPPRTGACYRLSAAEVQRPTNSSETVPCTRRHSAQTYHVGMMPKTVGGAAKIADYVTPRCDDRFTQHVGSDRNARILSRLQPVWFVPSRSEISRGARWFRCDVVGLAAADELVRLPVSTAGVLEQPGILDTYGLCSTASPSLRDDHHVACGQPHTWRAFTVIRLKTAGAQWPSWKRLAAARQECKTRARVHQGYPLEWTYGWQPPTRAQWHEGRHWGYCWALER